MRLVSVAIALGALIALSTTIAAQVLDDPVEELLSGVDSVPSRTELDDAAGTDAEAELLVLAAEGSSADTGIRIRALRALAMYPSTESQTTLSTVIETRAGGGGVDTLYLRAAMRSLAVIATTDAVDTIAALLTHDSRDVRAAAARALAITGSPAAVPLLRDRLGVEPTLQVRLALSAAIRELTGIPLPEQ